MRPSEKVRVHQARIKGDLSSKRDRSALSVTGEKAVVLATPVGVTRSHLVIGDIEVHHHLAGEDIQIIRVSAAEILSMFGRVCWWPLHYVMHSTLDAVVASDSLGLRRVVGLDYRLDDEANRVRSASRIWRTLTTGSYSDLGPLAIPTRRASKGSADGTLAGASGWYRPPPLPCRESFGRTQSRQIGHRSIGKPCDAG